MSAPPPSEPKLPEDSPESGAGLYDFLYLDRPRIGSYHAQVTNLGTWTATSSTETATSSRDAKGGLGFPKLIGGKASRTTGTQESYQRQFDPAMLVAVETLEKLEDEGSIASDLRSTPLGSLILVSGEIEILDVRLVRLMWEPLAAMFQAGAPPSRDSANNLPTRQARRAAARATASTSSPGKLSSANIATIAQNLPHAVQATLETDTGDLAWSTLEPEHFIGSPDSMTLMHGASIVGKWSMFAVLDARPDQDSFADPFSLTASNIVGVMRGLQSFIRQQFGRPEDAYGVTPLAIYRPLPRGTASSAKPPEGP